MEKKLSFRPHHFLCALCFQGRGYSPAFVDNFQTIMDALNSEYGDDTLIEVVAHTDAICAPCPHRIGKQCQTEAKILPLDQAHLNALQLKHGMTLTWREAKKRIRGHITLNTFHTICESCSWKSYGMCEKILNEFLK